MKWQLTVRGENNHVFALQTNSKRKEIKKWSFSLSLKNGLPTDGPTDGRTDRRTDISSYRDVRTHLKMKTYSQVVQMSFHDKKNNKIFSVKKLLISFCWNDEEEGVRAPIRVGRYLGSFWRLMSWYVNDVWYITIMVYIILKNIFLYQNATDSHIHTISEEMIKDHLESLKRSRILYQVSCFVVHLWTPLFMIVLSLLLRFTESAVGVRPGHSGFSAPQERERSSDDLWIW